MKILKISLTDVSVLVMSCLLFCFMYLFQSNPIERLSVLKWITVLMGVFYPILGIFKKGEKVYSGFVKILLILLLSQVLSLVAYVLVNNSLQKHDYEVFDYFIEYSRTLFVRLVVVYIITSTIISFCLWIFKKNSHHIQQ